MSESNWNLTPVYKPDTRVFIYGLIDPRDGRLRYVGRTKNTLVRRLKQHIKDAKRERDKPNHRIRWIKLLISLRLAPTIIELEECRGDGAAQEKYHIRLAMSDGCNLVNSNDGGDGPMWLSDELRAKLSHAAKGRRHTEETKALVSSLSKKMWANADPQRRERVRRLGQANRERLLSPAYRRMLAESRRGLKQTEKQKIAASLARKGKPWTEKRRAAYEKIAALRPPKPPRTPKRKRHNLSPETKQEIIRKYIEAGHCSATKALAKEYGVSFQLISAILRDNNVKLHPHSLLPDQVDKMRKGKTGKKQSAEHVEKRISKVRGMKRGPFTEEHRRKLSESHKGKKQSPEFVKRRIAAALAAKAAKQAQDTLFPDAKCA